MITGRIDQFGAILYTIRQHIATTTTFRESRAFSSLSNASSPPPPRRAAIASPSPSPSPLFSSWRGNSVGFPAKEALLLTPHFFARSGRGLCLRPLPPSPGSLPKARLVGISITSSGSSCATQPPPPPSLLLTFSLDRGGGCAYAPFPPHQARSPKLAW